jgi:nitrite reductase (NO-forming)
LLLVALVIAGAVALGCSGDDDDDGETAPTAASGSTAPAGGGGSTVEISAVSGNTYDPRRVEVEAGAEFTVQFTNEDSIAHTFTIQNGPDSGNVAPGGSAEITFEAPWGGGGIAFFCTIHGQSSMNGTIEYR